jgi:hypothetical protein
MIKCNKCGEQTDKLALFPGGICLACYEQTAEARRQITAEELVAMWGGGKR